MYLVLEVPGEEAAIDAQEGFLEERALDGALEIDEFVSGWMVGYLLATGPSA